MRFSRRRVTEPEESTRESALASRDAFVREVALTIEQRHGKGAESFVFGLSGRWGEGKTFFLEQLRHELKDRGFEVIDLNPWKYAADRVAFLRSFLLRLLDSQSRRQRFLAARRALTGTGRLSQRVNRAWAALDPLGAVTRRRLRVDVSRQSISWVRLLLLAPVLYWLLALTSSGATNDVQPWEKWLAAIPVGLAIWLVQGLVASQVSTKAATALDDFDVITSAALGLSSDSEDRRPAVRKVVVLVDDLDRVTARVARDVLDNLRTFFDKPALTFVVTGDHEILEANLGMELAAPDAAPEERKELGRLFLKKIFNVYWRLPLPVPSEFERFVETRLEAASRELEQLIPDTEDRARLRQWLLLYAGNNLRQVERALDAALFALRLANAQRQAAHDSEQQRVLTQMCEEPLLLARILFIQDRCAPFFELLAANAEILYELDVAVHEARVEGAEGRQVVSEFLKRWEDSCEGGSPLRLTDAQRSFLISFMYERPSFHDPDRGGKYVPSLAPWIHLACDAGLQDSAGPRAEDMQRAIENQNREALAAQLATCSETRAEEVAPRVAESLIGDSDANQRYERVRLILEELADASPDAPLVRRLTDALDERLADLLVGFIDPQRVSVLMALAAAWCQQGFEAIPDDAQQYFAFRGTGDLAHVARAQLDSLQSQVVIEWLQEAYARDQASALKLIEELAPHVANEGQAASSLPALMTRIREDLLADQSDDRKTLRLGILNDHGRAELGALKDEVLGRVDEQAVWQWAVTVEDAGLWNVADLEDALLNLIQNAANDPQKLLGLLRYSSDKLASRACDLWGAIEKAREDGLLGIVDMLAGETSLALPLPQELATRLYKALADTVWEIVQVDEPEAVAKAQLLNPGLWLWTELERGEARKALSRLCDRRYRFRQVQSVVRPFRESLS